MAWLKWHIGSSADPKFRVIAKHTKSKISEVIAVWLMVLEYAYEYDGSIEGLNREIIEAALNMRLDKVNAIFESMYELGLLADTLVAKWEERQAVPERSQKQEKRPMSNAERQRRHRENKQCENNDRNGV